MWREYRGNCEKTGQASVQGPDTLSVKWEMPIGAKGVVDDPVSGLNGEIIIATHSGKGRAFDAAGNSLWSVDLGDSPRGACVLGSGNAIFPRAGKIVAISPQGGVAWEHAIDGVPSPASILTKDNAILAPAYSFDWLGAYRISEAGTGTDYPILRSFSLRHQGTGVAISPAAVAPSSRNAYFATRTFGTYTWDPEDGPEAEHRYFATGLRNDGGRLFQKSSSSLRMWGGCGSMLLPGARISTDEVAIFLLESQIYSYRHLGREFTSIFPLSDLFKEKTPEAETLEELVQFPTYLHVPGDGTFNSRERELVYRLAKLEWGESPRETPPRSPEITALPCFLRVKLPEGSSHQASHSVDVWYEAFTSAPVADAAGSIYFGIPGGVACITPDGEKHHISVSSKRDPIVKLIIASEDCLVCVSEGGTLSYLGK